MDANGLHFWMLATRSDWDLAHSSGVQYDAETATLTLASERVLAPIAQDQTSELDTDARSRLERLPQTTDAYDTRALWDAQAGAVMATGVVQDAVPIHFPGSPPTDLAMGYDGILYLAISGAVTLLDRRDRWSAVKVALGGLMIWRLASDPRGGVWALDRVNHRIARVHGTPLPDRLFQTYAPTTVRPCPDNPDAPRITPAPAAAWPAAEMPVGISCSGDGTLGILTWRESDDAHLWCLRPDGAFTGPITLQGAYRPYSLAWIDGEHVAVLLASTPGEAPVYPVGDQETVVVPVGDLYPLRAHDGGPFIRSVTQPPQYVSGAEATPLYPLSLPSFAAHGETSNQKIIDSGTTQTVWHRLYLEAAIPPGTGAQIVLAATDALTPPESPAEWHEHRFGDVDGDGWAVPHGAWVSSPSEIPFSQSLLPCPPERDRSGLFTALIQRANRPVRALRGRFLWARVALRSGGRSTPQIAALRAYGSRFSYLDHYLPELYRETLFGPDADRIIAAGETSTPSDFLERFLDNFEGILTPLEDRIAGAYLLTDPRTTPDDALEWLGSWIGVFFDPAYPEERRRDLLIATPQLYRRRGTPRGLALAIDVATNGAVSNGTAVLLEDFRLRRAFATILGADLSENDPLLAGMVVSDNSYVGDTLLLGDDTRKEFLAIFDPSATLTPGEEQAIDSLFDGLANRLTVLVHQDVSPQDLGLIRRVVEHETPAHVLSRVVQATYPFVVGMASLVGVDTYLGPHRQPQPVEVDVSLLGVRDLLQHPASLDPRLGGSLNGATPKGTGPPTLVQPPVANAGPPQTVGLGSDFLLDGGLSHASPGKHITQFVWTLLS